VYAIAYSAGKVYVGGTFTNVAGNDKADFLVVYDGTGWQPFCNSTTSGSAINGNVNALQIIGNTLWVGGSFQNGAGLATADYLLGCDLTTGAARSTVANDGDVSGSVYALTADSNGVLYAGGGFINLAGIPEADHVAAYNGSSWSAMGTGPNGRAVDDFVRSLTANGTTVYVGTDAVDVAGIAQADHVARWNGSAWSAVGTNSAGSDGWFPASTSIYALAPYGSILFAAGSFQNANGIATADDIAYFDGSVWRPLGSDGAGNGPVNAQPNALALANGMVIVAGSFTAAGGDTLARSIAARPLRIPDARIGGAAAGPFGGNDVYNATGVGEVRSVTVARGKSTTAYVSIQNDGIVPAQFRVHGSGTATGYAPSWYSGASNITASARAGSYLTALIAPGAAVTLRLVVNVSKTSASAGVFYTTVSSTPGTPTDTVRVKITAH
jgi:hypothetical protein